MTDREILRPLARQIAEMAADPSQAERKARYKALNRREVVQPVVLIHELPWNQLNYDGSLTLQCQDPLLRNVENQMRRTIFQWKHFQGDMIVFPTWEVKKHVSVGRISPAIQEEILDADHGNNIVSHHYIDQLADESSLDLIKTPEIRVDEEGTKREVAAISEAIGDILPVVETGCWNGRFFSPWDELSMTRGVEPILTDLVERPEYLLDMVEKYTNCALEVLDTLEKQQLLSGNPTTYIHWTAGLCDDLPGDTTGGVTRKNIWGRGMAQMFSAVSPRMHDEFEIEFAKRYFQGFSRVYYGCCEPLDNKIDIVRKIPNVTKISITPWANVDAAADKIGGDFVMAWKPNPAMVATPTLNEDALRKEVSQALAAARRNHTPIEVTLKDISSVHYNVENIVRWHKIVMEMCAE